MKRYHQVQVFNQGRGSYIDASACWVAVKQKQKQKRKLGVGNARVYVQRMGWLSS